ncbi:hypothetical protein C8R46DRAFT_475686 [Mycena filopes]|nr:hypothetical protein C8R46DRAFT_475686 [Mycena filopes]
MAGHTRATDELAMASNELATTTNSELASNSRFPGSSTPSVSPSSSHRRRRRRPAQHPSTSSAQNSLTAASEHNMHSPLLRLPPELLEHLALHLATLPPNLGPPAALLPLLTTCRALYTRLGGRFNVALWAKIGRLKFALGELGGALDGDPFDSGSLGFGSGRGSASGRGSKMESDARALHTLCLALRTIRTGDPYAPGAAQALKVAYWMLVGDDDAEEENPALTTPRAPLTDPTKNRNRRHLAWADARSYAFRYVLSRVWEGRWGERDAVDARPEHATQAWRVGWPRDTEGSAAAMWVVWFFEGEETLRAEPEAVRRHLMSLLLPFVVAPFRYASALAPPHHYTVPLLPAVFSTQSVALNAQGPEHARGAITVPTNHGAYPIYALGAPTVPPAPSAAPYAGSASGGSSPSVLRSSPRTKSASRLLTAPPARLLFFARMQVGARMGVPPHLPRDRAEAARRWAVTLQEGGTGAQPVGPTQADIHEKNGRPLVRFERQLAVSHSSAPTASTSTPAASSSSTPAAASSSSTPGPPAVDPQLEHELHLQPGGFTDGASGEADGRRWAPQRGRGKLCQGYGDPRPPTVTPPRAAAGSSASTGRASTSHRIPPPSMGPDARGSGNRGPAGAPTGRIGRVYELGSLVGLWAGTMLMPSEPPYTALVASPGGALPPGGLARDDFVAAARPVYMRIQEYHSFHPNDPLPPPPANSTTADEGLREAWLPPGTRVVGVGGGQVEVRAPAAYAARNVYDSRAPPVSVRRGEEEAYLYERVLEGTGRVREGAHNVEVCAGCAKVRERERARRAGAATSASMAGYDGEGSYESDHSSSGSGSDSRSGASGSYALGSSPRSQLAPSPSQNSTSSSQSTSASSQAWPEWSAPAWAGHGFEDDADGEGGSDGGWEAACDGVQDVVFAGATDPHHGQAWHHYDFAGRVRPWDGLIGLVMRPRDRTLGLATYFISGHLVGRDTFEGTWQMASQDVLAPSWGGSVCFARGED